MVRGREIGAKRRKIIFGPLKFCRGQANIGLYNEVEVYFE
jgi:hypothetical protein